MTEQEAKTKWCPMTRGATGNLQFPGNSGPNDVRYGSCVASICMMWRWRAEQEGVTATYVNNSRRLGYCGLAGKL